MGKQIQVSEQEYTEIINNNIIMTARLLNISIREIEIETGLGEYYITQRKAHPDKRRYSVYAIIKIADYLNVQITDLLNESFCNNYEKKIIQSKIAALEKKLKEMENNNEQTAD